MAAAPRTTRLADAARLWVRIDHRHDRADCGMSGLVRRASGPSVRQGNVLAEELELVGDDLGE